MKEYGKFGIDGGVRLLCNEGTITACQFDGQTSCVEIVRKDGVRIDVNGNPAPESGYLLPGPWDYSMVEGVANLLGWNTPCGYCNGWGVLNMVQCPQCGGSGQVRQGAL